MCDAREEEVVDCLLRLLPAGGCVSVGHLETYWRAKGLDDTRGSAIDFIKKRSSDFELAPGGVIRRTMTARSPPPLVSVKSPDAWRADADREEQKIRELRAMREEIRQASFQLSCARADDDDDVNAFPSLPSVASTQATQHRRSNIDPATPEFHPQSNPSSHASTATAYQPDGYSPVRDAMCHGGLVARTSEFASCAGSATTGQGARESMMRCPVSSGTAADVPLNPPSGSSFFSIVAPAAAATGGDQRQAPSPKRPAPVRFPNTTSNLPRRTPGADGEDGLMGLSSSTTPSAAHPPARNRGCADYRPQPTHDAFDEPAPRCRDELHEAGSAGLPRRHADGGYPGAVRECPREIAHLRPGALAECGDLDSKRGAMHARETAYSRPGTPAEYGGDLDSKRRAVHGLGRDDTRSLGYGAHARETAYLRPGTPAEYGGDLDSKRGALHDHGHSSVCQQQRDDTGGSGYGHALRPGTPAEYGGDLDSKRRVIQNHDHASVYQQQRGDTGGSGCGAHARETAHPRPGTPTRDRDNAPVYQQQRGDNRGSVYGAHARETPQLAPSPLAAARGGAAPDDDERRAMRDRYQHRPGAAAKHRIDQSPPLTAAADPGPTRAPGGRGPPAPAGGGDCLPPNTKEQGAAAPAAEGATAVSRELFDGSPARPAENAGAGARASGVHTQRGASHRTDGVAKDESTTSFEHQTASYREDGVAGNDGMTSFAQQATSHRTDGFAKNESTTSFEHQTASYQADGVARNESTASFEQRIASYRTEDDAAKIDSTTSFGQQTASYQAGGVARGNEHMASSGQQTAPHPAAGAAGTEGPALLEQGATPHRPGGAAAAGEGATSFEQRIASYQTFPIEPGSAQKPAAAATPEQLLGASPGGDRSSPALRRTAANEANAPRCNRSPTLQPGGRALNNPAFAGGAGASPSSTAGEEGGELVACVPVGDRSRRSEVAPLVLHQGGGCCVARSDSVGGGAGQAGGGNGCCVPALQPTGGCKPASESDGWPPGECGGLPGHIEREISAISTRQEILLGLLRGHRCGSSAASPAAGPKQHPAPPSFSCLHLPTAAQQPTNASSLPSSRRSSHHRHPSPPPSVSSVQPSRIALPGQVPGFMERQSPSPAKGCSWEQSVVVFMEQAVADRGFEPVARVVGKWLGARVEQYKRTHSLATSPAASPSADTQQLRPLADSNLPRRHEHHAPCVAQGNSRRPYQPADATNSNLAAARNEELVDAVLPRRHEHLAQCVAQGSRRPDQHADATNSHLVVAAARNEQPDVHPGQTTHILRSAARGSEHTRVEPRGKQQAFESDSGSQCSPSHRGLQATPYPDEAGEAHPLPPATPPQDFLAHPSSSSAKAAPTTATPTAAAPGAGGGGHQETRRAAGGFWGGEDAHRSDSKQARDDDAGGACVPPGDSQTARKLPPRPPGKAGGGVQRPGEEAAKKQPPTSPPVGGSLGGKLLIPLAYTPHQEYRGVIDYLSKQPFGPSSQPPKDRINPVYTHSVQVSVSSLAAGAPRDIVACAPKLFSTDDGAAGQWFSVRLLHCRVVPTHYTLAYSVPPDVRAGEQPCRKPRTWSLEASADGVDYRSLCTHADDDAFGPGDRPHDVVVSFKLHNPDQDRFYQYFRVVQQGPNAAGTHHFCASGFEVYGILDMS
ncbi:BTB/POZ domain-containing protein [Diplonema papillatum]|nr:BTB/POZ domain-containing protein [Diplonema papillatum]